MALLREAIASNYDPDFPYNAGDSCQAGNAPQSAAVRTP